MSRDNWQEKAEERRKFVAECRAVFGAEKPNIYAIEYVYRHWFWTVDRRGKVESMSNRALRSDSPWAGEGPVFWKTVPDGVHVALRDPGGLAFGQAHCGSSDKWNKYIGLAWAIKRAQNHDMTGGALFYEFMARQKAKFTASCNRRLYGNNHGEVTITARGDTRLEIKP